MNVQEESDDYSYQSHGKNVENKNKTNFHMKIVKNKVTAVVWIVLLGNINREKRNHCTLVTL